MQGPLSFCYHVESCVESNTQCILGKRPCFSPHSTHSTSDALFMRTSTFTFIFQNNQKYLGHQVRRRSFSRETSLLKKAKSHKPAQSCLYTEVVSINLKRIFHSDSAILLSQCTAKQPKGGAKDLGKNFLSPTF